MAYRADWKIGDTFVHPLLQDSAKKAGLLGMLALFRKVGEYEDRSGRLIQLVYVTLCPEDAIPQTEAELASLGLLRVMEHGEKWDYLCQICFKSKKDEESWGLKRIGCFPCAGSPPDAAEEIPDLSMPLFGRRKNADVPGFENQISLFFRQHGIWKPTER